MHFVQGLLTARAHIAFLVGLGLSLGVVWQIERHAPRAATTGIVDFRALVELPQLAQPKLAAVGVPLSDAELTMARTAWRYFENNTQAATGFVNSVDKYPSTTLWDLGSYAMALLAAADLGIIDNTTATARETALLKSLAAVPLVEGRLPNKAYDTRTLHMVDYANRESPRGIGWSSIDIARLGVPLTILAWRHPEQTAAVKAVLAHLHLNDAVRAGALEGADRRADGSLRLVQEGRFGYEQYAAKSLFLFGLDVSRAIRYDVGVRVVDVSDQAIAYDARLPKDYGNTHNAVLSEPYLLEALEFGLTEVTSPLTASVYSAQRNHFAETHHLTAVSEDNIDRAPWFVYNSVLNGMKAWAAFAPDGTDASTHKTLSTKAAVGWAYLYDDDYAHALRAAVVELQDPARGFYSGRYDNDGAINRAITSNTNAVVLEALWYKKRGPLVAASRQTVTP